MHEGGQQDTRIAADDDCLGCVQHWPSTLLVCSLSRADITNKHLVRLLFCSCYCLRIRRSAAASRAARRCWACPPTSSTRYGCVGYACIVKLSQYLTFSVCVVIAQQGGAQQSGRTPLAARVHRRIRRRGALASDHRALRHCVVIDTSAISARTIELYQEEAMQRARGNVQATIALAHLVC